MGMGRRGTSFMTCRFVVLRPGRIRVQQQLDALVAWHNPTCYFPVQEGFSVFS